MATNKTEEKIDTLEEKILLSWKSVERPFKKRSKDFYSTVMVLAILVGIIFFFIEGLMPVLLVAAVVFVVFALSRTEPGTAEHVITNKGVVNAGEKYTWDELVFYWIEERDGYRLLNLITSRRFPVQLVLVLAKEMEDKQVKKVIDQFIPYRKPDDTRMDRMVKWVQEKVPLEES